MSVYIADEAKLRAGGELAENFCLRPKYYADQSVIVRIRINEKWSGWKLREDVISQLQLEIGATIVTNVSVYFTNDLSVEVNNVDLFASGEGADWLIDNKVGAGDVIDCQVKLSYISIPARSQSCTEIPKVSLIFEKGLAVVARNTDSAKEANELLESILQTLVSPKI